MTEGAEKGSAALRREAIDWVVRLRDADAAEWEAFERWMAADARASDMYWSVAEADADVAEALSRPRPARAAPPVTVLVRPRSRQRWLPMGAALAASLLLAIAAYSLVFDRRPVSGTMMANTAPGVTKTLDLDDGSEVVLNGGSQLRIDRTRPRLLRLETGEARFTVAHDPGRPFVVRVGRAEVVDLGTVFAITHEGNNTVVAVAEGVVRVDSEGRSHRLLAGEILRLAADGRVLRGRVAPSSVASWVHGRLAYESASLELVAADLARATGLRVTMAPSLKARRFSGGFTLGARDADTIRRAAHVVGVEARKVDGGWVLEGAESRTR